MLFRSRLRNTSGTEQRRCLLTLQNGPTYIQGQCMSLDGSFRWTWRFRRSEDFRPIRRLRPTRSPSRIRTAGRWVCACLRSTPRISYRISAQVIPKLPTDHGQHEHQSTQAVADETRNHRLPDVVADRDVSSKHLGEWDGEHVPVTWRSRSVAPG